MIRQEVHQPQQLQGMDSRSQRRLENAKAIGGMRNPRVSLHEVPGHRCIGAQVAEIIDSHLDQHPVLQAKLLRAIGDTTKNEKGPSKEEIKPLILNVERFFRLPAPDPTQWRTQLHWPLYEAWVRMADDPDVHVPRWLRQGAPMGIKQTAEFANIFPKVDQPAPVEDRRGLCEPGEQFVNYTSTEEPEHGYEVLQELVRKEFVVKTPSLDKALARLKGKTPILSKLALITTTKDGVLKHRLILDCRVSGVNDHARETERII